MHFRITSATLSILFLTSQVNALSQDHINLAKKVARCAWHAGQVGAGAYVGGMVLPRMLPELCDEESEGIDAFDVTLAGVVAYGVASTVKRGINGLRHELSTAPIAANAKPLSWPAYKKIARGIAHLCQLGVGSVFAIITATTATKDPDIAACSLVSSHACLKSGYEGFKELYRANKSK